MKSFYVTTPIYYVNDKPHIGHGYSTVAADVLSRYHRLRGQPTRFLTGLDEHGQKIERRAEEVGMAPQAFVDSMVPPFKQAWVDLRCEHDDFIRTTEPRHEEKVQVLWKMLVDAGDIYLGDYEAWYCVGCEEFKTEKELDEGNICPMHERAVEKVKEQSYFFKLSKYTQPLLDFYEANPKFVQPEGRFNEVKSFVKEGLRDLSISRTSFTWGVPVPGDEKHVMYVWIDALTNYLSALGGPGDSELYKQFWSEDATRIHIVGKDILRFHTVFWPAFLMSAGLPLPTQVWAHGWLTVNGKKMSKGLGNFLPPKPLVDAFGADVLRYYFMREVGFGQDGDFSHKNLIARYNGELGNGLGNLLNRMVSSIVKKSFDGTVPEVDLDALLELDRELIATAKAVATKTEGWLEEIYPHRALEAVWELVAAANRYIDQTEPWKLAKADDGAERLGQVAYTIMEALRWLSVMLWPFMPDKCDELRAQLGLEKVSLTVDEDQWPSTWGGLPAGTQTAPAEPLFPRIDKDREAELLAELAPVDPDAKPAAAKKTGGKKGGKPAPEPPGIIEFDDFMKVELKVGLVQSAEPLPKSKKLLKLMVDVGEESPRQILAGISQHYDAEALIGRRVAVVTNLAPRKMMGTESQGMVLAGSDDSGLSVLGLDKDIAPGTRIT